MTQKIPATAAMLVKNSERYLPEVLNALVDFDEVLLLDNGSTDNTFKIAKQFENVSYYKHDFIGFGPLKNLAANLARNDWIFSIDSDEVADQTLIEAIREAVSKQQTDSIYSLNRLNHYNGRLIKACGWYPDVIPRLYHRKFTQFSERQVHESLNSPQNATKQLLSGHLKHYSFENAEGLIQKMQQYSSLYAQENQYKKSASPPQALLHGGVSFIKNYWIKKGFLYGSDGLIISAANAQGSYYKYIKLYERNRQLRVSLIITTYNRPDALSMVLKSALSQTHLPNEIIVADDGSTPETAEAINIIQQKSNLPIKHVWQEDNGFRAARSRNQALAAAQYDYIILIDGDMVLDPSFIADHINLAQKGRLLQGSRVLLTQEKTKQLLLENHLPSLSFIDKGIEKRISALRLPWLSQLLGKKGNQKHKGIKTCNMSFFKEDALAVNGFNNDFIGWGREDSEFVARCYHYGIKRHNLKFAGIAYHLWHNESERDALPQNDAILQETLSKQKTYCDNGVSIFLNK